MLQLGKRSNNNHLSRTWPVGEQVIDILHKAVFALVTGYFTDKWVQ